MKINRKFFFEYTKINLFEGRFKQSQVNGLNIFLNFWEAKHSRKDDRFLAYILGTAHHEVDRKFQPIKEYGTKAYFKKRYDIEGDNPKLAKELGNLSPGDGAKYHGRGYVQITGRANYQVWKNKLNKDLIGKPHFALEPDIAAQIIFGGMIMGTFTGKKLSDYFNGTTEDWKNARKIVNRLDRAELIASYSRTYYAAISYVS